VAKRTRRRGGKSRCLTCGHLEGIYGCDGVVTKDPWQICNRPLCSACATAGHLGTHYCQRCAIERGLVARDVGEEG